MIALALSIVLLGGSAGIGVHRFGSLSHTLAYARGVRLLADEPTMDLGPMEAGSRMTFAFRLTNLTGRPIKLIGAQTSCSCMVVDDLPTTIPPLQSRAIPVGIEAPSQADMPASGSVRFFTDEPDALELALGYTG